MGSELKNKVAAGVAWNIAEKTGSMLLQMAVSIVVARLLMPEDFGVMAIMTFFTSLALVIVDSGFPQTLIRRQNPAPEEFSSVFFFNLIMSAALYVLLTATAPAVAAFYDMPVIADIAPVLFLLLPVNALCSVQNAIFVRGFRFGLLSKATFAASLVGGAAAIVMALAGCGVWSLAGQRLATAAAKSAILWLCSDWRPSARASTAPVREMAPFSLRLLTTDIIGSVYNNIAQMCIGKVYPADTLGYFNQAQKFKDLPVTSAMQSVQSVTYPALSNIRSDRDKFAESYRQVLTVTAFMMFPLMAGLAAAADEMFMVLLGEKWMPTVPYLRILCITGLFIPLTSIAGNILKAASDGRIIVRLEIVKKAIMTAVLAATLTAGVKAVAWGLAAMSAIDFLVTFAATTRYTTLTLPRMVRSLLPAAAVTALMYAAVIFAGQLTGTTHEGLRLMVKIITGIAVYTSAAFAFRLESVREIRTIVKKIFGR